MKVTIVGAGNVGAFIAADLHDAGHEVTLVERDASVAARKQFALEVNWVIGDACEYDTMEELGLETMDVVVAATGDDEDNLVVSMLAKQEFAVPSVVARVNHPKNEWLFNASWGVDVAVSTPHILTSVVEEAVSVGSLVRLLKFQGGHARLIEVTLADNSPAINKTVGEISEPHDAAVVAVVRSGHVIVPKADVVVQAGDEVLALISEEGEDEIKASLIGSDQSNS